MDIVIIFTAICAFSAQVRAFRCWQELKKIRLEVERTRSSESSIAAAK